MTIKIEVTKIKIGEREHSVEMYGQQEPDDAKRVIQGAPTRWKIQENKENIIHEVFNI